mmetsp:Transcript_27379/g.57571  ORF Transcript_27379/g.57571 Transcript_27379/m.57571 type:complete len:200 (+) Transcript_27379:376-975(+)
MLFKISIVGYAQFAIQQNTLRSTSSVWKLLRHECPSSLEISRFIKNVHRSSGSLAAPSLFHEKLGHYFTRVDPTCNGVSMLTVIRIFLVPVLNSIVNKCRDGFLSIVKMHKSPDFTLHVLLVAGIFKSTCQLKCFINFHQSFFVVFHFRVVCIDLFIGISKGIFELNSDILPDVVNWRSHQIWFRCSFGSRLGDSGGHS